MLEVSVLGPVEVRSHGSTLTIPGGRTAELLVRLAMEAGTAVRAERLVEELWGDAAASTRPNTLQAKVTRLRRALGRPDALVAVGGGYALMVDRDAVDALHVLDAAADSARSLAAGDLHAAAVRSAAALARFRGEALVTAGDADWVVPFRTRLDAAHASLLETRLGAQLQAGAGVGPADVGDLVDGLETAVARHPFHEHLWALLVTALYRAGRQADALAAYQRCRAGLADELGLEPGPELRELERQILQQDPSLPSAAAPSPAAPGRRGNVPSFAVELVGRAREVEALGRLVATRRLVTVVGPGGVGKTALALAMGRSDGRPDGVWVVRLESASTASEIVDALVAALEVSGDERVALARLRAAGSPLVILDNGEHVLDALADLVPRFLDGAPGLHVLCTSQAPLGVDGEVLFDLGPLVLEDAVALFAERAAPAHRGRERAEGDRVVHDLCRALDGLPLAIELAAARTRTLSVDEIARRLDDRFQLLADPTSRRPARRRALGAAIAWSYELLFPDDQRGLWALATFGAGASFDAVEAVLRALDVPPTATLDVLDRLVARSLVIVDDTTPVRYRLLESIRAFALQRLDEAGASPAAGAARARWFAEVAASSTAGVRGRDQAVHLHVARTERANIDAALAWCAAHDPRRGLAIASGFGWAWVVLGDSRGAQRVVAALDAAGPETPAAERADALLLAGWLEASIGDLERARGHLADATDLADALDDPALRARCWYHLAYVLSHEGDFTGALACTDRARAVYDAIDRPWDRVANALFALRAAISAGDGARSDAAAVHAETALAAVDDPWLHVRLEALRGEQARLQRRFGDAVDHLARAAATSAALGFLQTEAFQVATLGRARWLNGDDELGAATLALAVDKAEAVGDVRMAALARVHLGRVRRALGDANGAREALEAAAAWHREAGGGEQALLGDCALAALDAAELVPGAQDRLEASLAAARSSGAHPHVEVLALDALARLARRSGDLDESRTLAEEADGRMGAASHVLGPRDRTDAPEPGLWHDPTMSETTP